MQQVTRLDSGPTPLKLHQALQRLTPGMQDSAQAVPAAICSGMKPCASAAMSPHWLLVAATMSCLLDLSMLCTSSARAVSMLSAQSAICGTHTTQHNKERQQHLCHVCAWWCCLHTSERSHVALVLASASLLPCAHVSYLVSTDHRCPQLECKDNCLTKSQDTNVQ